MKILHISDTHVGGSSHFNPDALAWVEEEVHSTGYDFLIHTGDVTQEGKSEQYLEAREFLEGVRVPRIVIPGNHDVRSGGIALFEKHVGQRNGVEVFGDAVVIYVDSAVADSNDGRVGMIKYNMIREALHEYHHMPVKIVVIHHHTIPTPRAGRERNVLSNAGDLLDMFLRFDVDLVLSGHRHYPNVYGVENSVFVNAGPVSCRKTRYGDANSYNVIEIDDEEISVETRRMEGTSAVQSFNRARDRVFDDFGRKQGRIVQMSNSFISHSPKFLPTHFWKAIDTINEMEPDVVVHCGGVVEEGISANYDLARNYMTKIDAPVVYTPAARDLNYLGYHLFPRYFGPLDQSYSDDDMLLQGVCSSQYDSPIGVVGRTERQALFEKLNGARRDLTCLFCHHNLTPIPHAREKGLLEDAGDLLRESVDAGIDLILTGTSSHPYAVKIGSTVIVNANAVSSVYQRSTYGHSFNVVDIYEKVIAVSEMNSLWGTQKISGMWWRE